MNEAQAQALFAIIRTAFPQTELEEPTVHLHEHALGKLESFDAAAAAVEQVINEASFFPSIAEIRVAYHEQRRREREKQDSDRRARELEEFGSGSKELPPEVHDWLSGFRLRGMGRGERLAKEKLGSLRRLGIGTCEDCKSEAELARYGSVNICARCAGKRVGVAVKLEEKERREREQQEATP